MYYTTTPEIEKSYYNGEVRVIQSIHIILICIYCVIEVNFCLKMLMKELDHLSKVSDPKFNLNIQHCYLDLSVECRYENWC